MNTPTPSLALATVLWESLRPGINGGRENLVANPSAEQVSIEAASQKAGGCNLWALAR